MIIFQGVINVTGFWMQVYDVCNLEDIFYCCTSHKVCYYRFSSTEMGENKSFEPLPLQHSCSYRVRIEDIGRCLRCECTVTDVFGRSSDLAYAETSPVSPGPFLFQGSIY